MCVCIAYSKCVNYGGQLEEHFPLCKSGVVRFLPSLWIISDELQHGVREADLGWNHRSTLSLR